MKANVDAGVEAAVRSNPAASGLGARRCRCPNWSVLSYLSSRHIRGDVYVKSGRLKWNTGDFARSGA
jgi:hypothetical protein